LKKQRGDLMHYVSHLANLARYKKCEDFIFKGYSILWEIMGKSRVGKEDVMYENLYID
jgi:hypothetical protein